MTAPVFCRATVDPQPASGAWNMAVDEALLEAALSRGEYTVRCYRWREATLSLGYFQKEEEAKADPRLAGLPCVRRLTGGGAILHHHELTYSCALPPGHPLAAVPHRLYEHVHAEIHAVLAGRDVPAALRGDATGESRPQEQGRREASSSATSFLCFARGDARDGICCGHKVLGSAQRRRRGAVLQHGSLLLARSEHAPEFPGIRDLVPGASLDDSLAEELTDRIARLLAGSDGTIRRGPLPERDRRRAAELEAARARNAAPPSRARAPKCDR